MISFEDEQRPEFLRQIAHLLDRENRKLHQRLQKLTAELAPLQGTDEASLQVEIDQLQEILERLERRERTIFGGSSERRRRREWGPPPSRPRRQATAPASSRRWSLPVVLTRMDSQPG